MSVTTTYPYLLADHLSDTCVELSGMGLSGIAPLWPHLTSGLRYAFLPSQGCAWVWIGYLHGRRESSGKKRRGMRRWVRAPGRRRATSHMDAITGRAPGVVGMMYADALGEDALVSKEYIVAEIRRVADESGSVPGMNAFESATGVRPDEWRGRYWARWSDAVREAGLEPNSMNAAIDPAAFHEGLCTATRERGRFPTLDELSLRRRTDPSGVSEGAIRRRGGVKAVIEQLREYCLNDPDAYADVLMMLPDPVSARAEAPSRSRDDLLGFVYLIKSGKHYKIGRTNALGRRERELAIQLPEKAKTVHAIETDDPVGIETYWHRRFADKRVRADAEWFRLDAADVAAFKRRRFQ